MGACKALIFVASLTAACLPLPARSEGVSDAVRHAFETNPGLLAQRLAAEGARELYTQARAGGALTANLAVDLRLTSGSVHRSDGPRTDYSGSSHNVVVRLNQPVYTGGRVNADVRSAVAQGDRAKALLRDAEGALVREVLISHISLHRDAQILASATSQQTTLESELAGIVGRLEAKEATVVDKAQAVSGVADSRVRVGRATSELAASRNHYRTIVGQYPAKLEAITHIVVPSTLAEAERSAQDKNPLLQASRYAFLVAEAELAKTKAGRRPTASVALTAGDQPLSTVDPSLFARQATVSLNMTMPLSTGGMNASKVRQAALEVKRRSLMVDQHRLEIIEAVNRSWHSHLAAGLALSSAAEQVAAATTAFNAIKEARYAGMRTTQDVLNAQQALQDAETARLKLMAEYHIAGVDILYNAGLLEPDAVSGLVR